MGILSNSSARRRRANHFFSGMVAMSHTSWRDWLERHPESLVLSEDTGSWRDYSKNPYQVEHDVLFDAVSKGEYRHADTENAAYSTMTAIMGRMATYSGQEVSWDEALNSEISLVRDFASWGEEAPVQPNPDGSYPVAVPGKTIAV